MVDVKREGMSDGRAGVYVYMRECLWRAWRAFVRVYMCECLWRAWRVWRV